MSSDSTELVQADATPVILSGDSWDALTQGADEVFGGELEKAESLVGVPFVILRLTFRRGDFARKDKAYDGEPGDYVSVDLVTAPADVIARRIERGKIETSTVIADPSTHLVLNLSGTAAYRELVKILEYKRLIQLPKGPDGETGPESGEFGESRFDTPVRLWGIHNVARVKYNDDGTYQSAEFDVRIHAPRGLRASTFDNRHGKDISVYYLG